MMRVVYNKETLQIVGSPASNETIEQFIEKDVLFNFGGITTNYTSMEIPYEYFRLERINGEVVAVELKTPESEPQPPTETEILMDYVVNVDYRVTALELGII